MGDHTQQPDVKELEAAHERQLNALLLEDGWVIIAHYSHNELAVEEEEYGPLSHGLHQTRPEIRRIAGTEITYAVTFTVGAECAKPWATAGHAGDIHVWSSRECTQVWVLRSSGADGVRLGWELAAAGDNHPLYPCYALWISVGKTDVNAPRWV
ncbi:hypothetical protein EXIGLDRAFT_775821 [Exidia glandulosa HHB12029]|nr:hypothetical protein EXIGLDRAFT_775821 [Exidia glandulosa HHB12029]